MSMSSAPSPSSTCSNSNLAMTELHAPPTAPKTQEQNQCVMLADNFPAKAYLLITHLSQTEPSVASFSSDGTSFEIYDQSIFAQKYLPQYFKHSKYGSFVRQLNLYGFTSSRLKRNNDVVVWTHVSFHRDRKELVKEIKRTKKAKSAKPSDVHVSRTPSPQSFSDDASSTDNASKPALSSEKCSKDSGIDQVWLETELSYLKQQNTFLEEKMDTLLRITLQMSPTISSEEAQAGEKRLRTSPYENYDRAHYKLQTISETQMQSEGDYDGIYGEQKLFDGGNYGIEPVPYKSDRKNPPNTQPLAMEATSLGANNDESEVGDESLQGFIDIMLKEEYQEECKSVDVHDAEDSSNPNLQHDVIPNLTCPKNDIMMNEEDQEECKSVDVHDVENSSNPNLHDVTPNLTGPKNKSLTASPQESESDDNTMDDELMEEAMNAILPGATIDTDGDLFASEDAGQSNAQLQSSGHPTQSVTTTNRAVAKADGPQPIRAISCDIPLMQSGDIEEGNLPVGVTVVSAHAELVEEDNGNSNLSNEATLQLEQDRHHHERKDRRRALYLLAFIGVVLVVGITWPAVVLTSNNKKKREKMNNKKHEPSSSGDAPRKKRRGNKRHGPSSSIDGPRHKPHPFHKPCQRGRRGKHGGCHPMTSSEDSPGPAPNDGDGFSGWLSNHSEDHSGWRSNTSEDNLGWTLGQLNEEYDDNDQIEKRENSTEENESDHSDSLEGTTQDWKRSYSGVGEHLRGKRISFLSDAVHDGSLSSFSVTLEGTEFVCNLNP